MTPILQGNDRVAYRDPACICVGHTFYLFVTLSVKENGYIYNRIGLSKSTDLIRWSEPVCITEKNLLLNFSSPGNILPLSDRYRIFFCSYPLPDPWETRWTATNDARLFYMDTQDFVTFSAPTLMHAKGTTKEADMGRMIDPYVFEDAQEKGLYHLFFKQNGVSHSISRDLVHWEYQGHTEGGENACILWKDQQYHLFHSPQNGIGHKVSADLVSWEETGVQTLRQEQWPWAQGRLTAGFVMEAPAWIPHRYLLFFHGSRKDAFPETHGAASIGLCYTDDLYTFTE